MTELDPLDVAWAAGFLDGEGCFGISSSNGYFHEKVTVSQVDPRPLFKLKVMFGGAVQFVSCAYPRKDVYHYAVSSLKANRLIAAVRPYLTVKDAAADVLLEFRRVADTKTSRTAALTDDEIRARVALKGKIADINRRGRSA